MVQVIGHRGIAGLEPENTLRSFRRALGLGVQTVECDVRLSRDGHLVLMHDADVDRTTDGLGPVADLALAALRRLNAGQGERVPTLEELLALLAEREARAHVELKAPGTPRPVLHLLERTASLGRVVLTCGQTERLREVRSLSDAVAIEHIFADPPPDAIERALAVGASRISAHHRHATRAFVDAAHAAGLEVVAWPPNTVPEMQAAIALGVDLVCTDRPDLLLDHLRRTTR